MFVTLDKQLDFSYTHDGHILMSKRASDFLRENAKSSLVIERVLSNKGQMFHLDAADVVEFDVDRRPVVFDGKCKKCGQYLDIYHALPVYLRDPSSIGALGLAKTDLQAGHKDRKGPSFIVGSGLMTAMKEQKFKGLSFDAVRS